jgi:cytoskeletal protein CcmA (bactofilin family)
MALLRKNQSTPVAQQATISLLDKGCEFQGKLSFEGIVRIDGTFQGEIFSQGHLIVGEGAVVEANIEVNELELAGTFKGDIVARKKLVVHASARVHGNIKAQELEIQKGATVDGTVEMANFKDAAPDIADTIVRFDREENQRPV